MKRKRFPFSFIRFPSLYFYGRRTTNHPGTGSGAPPEKQSDKTQAILTAVSPLVAVFFGGSAGVNIIPPLICWLVWKDANPLVDKVGKNILNAQISWAIYTVAACLSCLILIGFVLAPVVVIAWIVFSIIAAVKAANGNYDYVAPFTIKFLK